MANSKTTETKSQKVNEKRARRLRMLLGRLAKEGLYSEILDSLNRRGDIIIKDIPNSVDNKGVFTFSNLRDSFEEKTRPIGYTINNLYLVVKELRNRENERKFPVLTFYSNLGRVNETQVFQHGFFVDAPTFFKPVKLEFNPNEKTLKIFSLHPKFPNEESVFDVKTIDLQNIDEISFRITADYKPEWMADYIVKQLETRSLDEIIPMVSRKITETYLKSISVGIFLKDLSGMETYYFQSSVYSDVKSDMRNAHEVDENNMSVLRFLERVMGWFCLANGEEYAFPIENPWSQPRNMIHDTAVNAFTLTRYRDWILSTDDLTRGLVPNNNPSLTKVLKNIYSMWEVVSSGSIKEIDWVILQFKTPEREYPVMYISLNAGSMGKILKSVKSLSRKQEVDPATIVFKGNVKRVPTYSRYVGEQGHEDLVIGWDLDPEEDKRGIECVEDFKEILDELGKYI